MPTYTAPKGYATGFSTRSLDQVQGSVKGQWLPIVETVVLEVFTEGTIAQGGDQPAVYPTNVTTMAGAAATTPTTAFTTWLNTQLTYLAQPAQYSGITGAPCKIVIRIRIGIWAQQWMKDLCGGSLPYCTANGWNDPAFASAKQGAALTGTAYPTGTYEVTGGTVQWWHPNWQAIHTKLHADIAAIAGTNGQVVEIDVCPTATQFQEWINEQFSIQRNLDTFIANGYTIAKHLQAMYDAWTALKPIWCTPYGVGLASSYNPSFLLSVTSGGANLYTPGKGTWHKTAWAQQVAILGNFALVQNKSFDQNFVGGWRDPNYADDGTTYVGGRNTDNQAARERLMWDDMTQLAVDTPEQTATLAKIDADGLTVRGTVQALVAFKGSRCELPTGCQSSSRGSDQITAAYAATWSPQITHHPERYAVAGSTLRGTFKGGSETATSTTYQGTLPAGIVASDVLLFSAAIGAGGVTVTGITIDGAAVTATSLGANPDTAGGSTNFSTYLWGLQGSTAYAGKQFVITLSGLTRGGMVGAVVTNATLSGVTSGVAFAPAAGTVTMPTVTDRGGQTVEFGWSRAAAGPPAMTLPGAYVNDDSYSTSSTGYGLTGAVGADNGTGGGDMTTSPAADKVTGYTVSVASATATTSAGAAFSTTSTLTAATSVTTRSAGAAFITQPVMSVGGQSVTPTPGGASITATANVALARIGVQLSGFSSPANGPITVYRQHADTTSYPVRGLTATSGGAAFAYDYEAPFNVPVTYYAMNGGGQVFSAPVTLATDTPWLSIPGLPSYGMEIDVTEKPTFERSRPQGQLSAFGRETAVVISDVRKSATFTIGIRARSISGAGLLDDILDVSAVALLRLPNIRQAWQYVSVSASPAAPAVGYRTPTGEAAGSVAQWETFSLDCTIVDAPIGGVYGDPTASYQAVKDTYLTYAALKAAKSTYLDVLKGV